MFCKPNYSLESFPVVIFLINFNCVQMNTGEPEVVMFGSVALWDIWPGSPVRDGNDAGLSRPGWSHVGQVNSSDRQSPANSPPC